MNKETIRNALKKIGVEDESKQAGFSLHSRKRTLERSAIKILSLNSKS